MVHIGPDVLYNMDFCSMISLIRTHTPREKFDTFEDPTNVAKFN